MKVKGMPKPHLYKRNGKWTVFNPLLDYVKRYPDWVALQWLAAYEWCMLQNKEVI